ncbi:MAG: OmpA family protein [Alphaproteobacteria bacterium]
MLTYSDMVTLLLTFFIMLVSISKIDANQYEQVQSGLKEGISKNKTERPLEQLKTDMKALMETLQIDGFAAVGTDQDGVVFELASSLLYDSGAAAIRQDGAPVVQALARTLLEPRYNAFQIEVQGHTDDVPIATAMFPSNWELSAARATGVVRMFIQAGIQPQRLKAIGLADVAPKVSNRDPNNVPLPQNQEVNRRIAVRVYPR